MKSFLEENIPERGDVRTLRWGMSPGHSRNPRKVLSEGNNMSDEREGKRSV